MSKKEVAVAEVAEVCSTEGCCEKSYQGNTPTPEQIQANATAFYNAALKIVEAGALVMPFNNPLGMTIVKLAEALTDQVGSMTGFGSQESQSCHTQKRNIELDEETLKEIESLEKELAGELGDL